MIANSINNVRSFYDNLLHIGKTGYIHARMFLRSNRARSGIVRPIYDKLFTVTVLENQINNSYQRTKEKNRIRRLRMYCKYMRVTLENNNNYEPKTVNKTNSPTGQSKSTKKVKNDDGLVRSLYRTANSSETKVNLDRLGEKPQTARSNDRTAPPPAPTNSKRKDPIPSL